ncbi:MAG: DegT/DnrJ/EryC1/StrS family aminotransferase [Terrimicrobiaceae bacterium]|nr:DegT/DnrJ/EryC1/StrS family aminotransferase [Terrimicrobiaceae bacterium]
MTIPFVHLERLHAPIARMLEQAIHRVIDAQAFSGGPFVEEFEQAFARAVGATSAVGVSSGTDALWLALAGLGIGPGDEVITAPNSFVATAEAIALVGATPVFVDIVPDTGLLDVDLLDAAITDRTRAVVPVHLHGRMVAMDRLLEVTSRRGLAVVEDACQAHGAVWKNRAAGTWGDAGCFSFYPSKNLGAFGEAGAVVTNNENLAAHVRALREHGQVVKDIHCCIGSNARMDGVQAAVLSAKLPCLRAWNHRRAEIARRFDELLADIVNIPPPAAERLANVHHAYVVRVPDRDWVRRHLNTRGIDARVHYPTPIHHQPAFRQFCTRGFPHAERRAAEILSLPIHPELHDGEIDYIAAALREALSRIRLKNLHAAA